MQDSYTIAMEIKSETYFGKGIFFFDLAFIFVYWFLMSNFEGFVHPMLQLPYTAFNVIVALILTRKSTKNPGKRIYQEVIYKLIGMRNMTYKCRERKYDQIEYIEEQ